MKNKFRLFAFASLLLGATLSFGPTAAQSSQVVTPPAGITCSLGLGTCTCQGDRDCSFLRNFAAAGGCSNLQCSDGPYRTCTCAY